MVRERCRVCGSGMVGTGLPASRANPKTCPNCKGTGMVEADRPVAYPPMPAPHGARRAVPEPWTEVRS